MVSPLALAVAAVAMNAAPGDNSAARRELLAAVASERTAHLTHDVDLLLSGLAPDFISVDHGEVTHPTRAQLRQRFSGYFSAVDFRAWDDIDPPLVEMSADGRFATVLIHKLVRTVPRGTANDPKAEVSETRFAWVEIWRKLGRRWENQMIVSTRSDNR